MKGETFNRRKARCFYVHPFLGFVAAPVFTWGMGFLLDDPKFWASANNLGIAAFVSGLLSKIVLELIIWNFKKVFKS